ncbi:MAG: sel1 repeat family protein [Holosporales bacterium]|jgi:TPR repeat protein|nr:sel1 repeat family protein [Holosporales bacterium]
MKNILFRLLVLFALIFSCSAENKFINNYVARLIYAAETEALEDYLLKSTSYPHPNATASYILGSLYLDGSILKKDLQKADIFITKAANMGLPEAINSIGDGYYSGDIRKKNIRKALEYYEKAAALGFKPSQFNAGIVLLRNAKNKNDLKRAILYLDKASKNSKDLKEITKAAVRYKIDAQKRLKNYK